MFKNKKKVQSYSAAPYMYIYITEMTLYDLLSCKRRHHQYEFIVIITFAKLGFFSLCCTYYLYFFFIRYPQSQFPSNFYSKFISLVF